MRGSHMHPIRSLAVRWARAVLIVGTLTGAGTFAACKDFLTADNPAAVPVERLEDTALVDLMTNSVVAALQGVGRSDTPSEQPFFWLTYLSATYTDELRNHHVFFEEGLYDQRRVFTENSYNSTF